MPVGTAVTEDNLADLRRRPGGHQRRLRPRRAAAQDPVLRVQVLPDLHPGRTRAGPAGRRRAQAVSRPASAAAGQRRPAAGHDRRRHDLPAGAGAAGADPVPAPRRGRPRAHRHPGRHRTQRPTQARRAHHRAATARGQVEAVLPLARRATPTTCTTATSSRPPWPPTTAPSTSAGSAPSCGGPDDRRTDDRADDRRPALAPLRRTERPGRDRGRAAGRARPPRLHLRAAHPRRNPVARPHRHHCPPGRGAVARAATAHLRRAAGRRAPLRQPAAPARRAARRRGRPDGPQLRRADHRDAGRPAGRDRRAAQRRAVPRTPRRAAPPLRRPGDHHRRARARPGDLGRPPGTSPATGCSTRSWCCDPPPRTARRPSRCPPSTACASATSTSWPPASDPATLRRRAASRRRPRRRCSTPAARPARRSWPRTPTPTRSPTPGCWPPTPLFEPDSAVFAALPLFHVNALVVTLLAPLFKGQPVVWAGPLGYRDPALFTRVLEDRRALPDRRDERGAHRLRRAGAAARSTPTSAACAVPIVGASPLPAAVRDGFQAHTGVTLLEGLRPDRGHLRQRPQLPRRPAAGLGRAAAALPAVKAVRVAPGRHLAGPARPARPASWRSAARRCSPATSPATASTATSWTGSASCVDGWLDTGDLARVDDDGFVHLAGRAKDLIIRGGHNIDPAIIEDALLAHPQVTRGRRRRPARRARR